MKALLTSLILAAPAASACEVALMLAVDVSASVDADEYRIQMDGLAEAFVHRSVMGALVASDAQVALMQWSGSGRQAVVIDWAQMSHPDDVAAFAFQIAIAPREWQDYSTAIAEALDVALPQFQAVDHCERFVIDISGDGINNEGPAPRDSWPALQQAGVTVNALVIEDTGFPLTAWFEAHVITGPGAFAVTANSYDEYPQQIIEKLYRELSEPIALAE